MRDDRSPALAVVVNADLSQGPVRLLFAINPTLADATISVGPTIAGAAPGAWSLLADEERFYLSAGKHANRPVEADLWLPALACGLWIDPGEGGAGAA
ncbi:MAG: hypothetical protein JNL39_07160 [Opitutaceae bacterium]|nr:hypothetical protein [Opitutaceae bacterium]